MQLTMIVVPCYNEGDRLRGDVFVRFAKDHCDVGFVFVNDGSTDGTADLLSAICDAAPNSLHSITLPQRVGKAEAVRRGFVDLLTIPQVRYVGFWDADLATPLDTIPMFLGIYDKHPEMVLVMGARVQLLGRCITRNSMRHYLGRVFATAASAVLSLPVYDTQCGAKLFRANAITRSVFEEPFATRWIFDVEILARMIRHQRRIHGRSVTQLVYELPLPQWHDMSGSKLRTRDYLLAARDLLVIRHRYPRGGA